MIASNFKQKVLEIVKDIPKGQVMTYKQVATLAGNPNGSRAVGMYMSKNWDPDIPCHRVIGSNLKLKGYNRGIENKLRILKEEGIDLDISI